MQETFNIFLPARPGTYTVWVTLSEEDPHEPTEISFSSVIGWTDHTPASWPEDYNLRLYPIELTAEGDAWVPERGTVAMTDVWSEWATVLELPDAAIVPNKTYSFEEGLQLIPGTLHEQIYGRIEWVRYYCDLVLRRRNEEEARENVIEQAMDVIRNARAEDTGQDRKEG